MSEVVIRCEGLSKQYLIGTGPGYKTLRESLASVVSSPFARVGRRLSRKLRGGNDRVVPLWALREVSLEIKRGEVVGVVGPNGAGKTTLLKVLGRIVEPSEGRAQVRGRVGSLLEVGTGFHPELTGRENIYLNGAILGMKRHEIGRKFDEIVDFAEVQRFIDTPVKRFSTGMQTRLAFAVAAHLDPEILLVDEVLAVGDASFQRKCLGKMSDVSKEGRTILFVSHNMKAVTDLCARAIWLDCGKMRRDGSAAAVVAEYLGSGDEAKGLWIRTGRNVIDSELELLEAQVTQADVNPTSFVAAGSSFNIEILYRVARPISGCSIVARLTDMSGMPIFTSWDSDSDEAVLGRRDPGVYRAQCEVTAHLLRPGRYTLTIAAHIFGRRVLDLQEHVLSFDVSNIGCRFHSGRAGVVIPMLGWTVSKVTSSVVDTTSHRGR